MAARKLNRDQVKELRRLSEHVDQKTLALRFKVSQGTVSNILTGKIYRYRTEYKRR